MYMYIEYVKKNAIKLVCCPFYRDDPVGVNSLSVVADSSFI